MARRIIDAAVIAVRVVVGADGNNAQELARGVVVDRIACLAEPSQAESTGAATLSKQAEIKKALARERDSDDSEMRMLVEVFDLEGVLRPGVGGEGRSEALARLRDRLSRLFKTANSAADSPERSRAWRVLRNVTSGAAGRVQDPEYLKLLEQYRLPLNGPSAISHRALEQAPTPRGR